MTARPRPSPSPRPSSASSPPSASSATGASASASLAGCLGIFGHGNVAGLGQALAPSERPAPFPPGPQRAGNGLHIAAGYARQRNRLEPPGRAGRSVEPSPDQPSSPGRRWRRDTACRSSSCPVNTFASPATHTRYAALELPLTRRRSTVLPAAVPLHDRVERPEQLFPSRLRRCGSAPSRPGAVSPALPEDVQSGGLRVPRQVPGGRVWTSAGSRRPPTAWRRPRNLIGRSSPSSRWRRCPVSPAREALRAFASHGMPGGRDAAQDAARARITRRAWARWRDRPPPRQPARPEADLVIGVRTRWSDFTTASKSAFQGPRRALCEHQRRQASTPPSSAGWRWWPTRARRWSQLARRARWCACAAAGSSAPASRAPPGRARCSALCLP